MRLIYGSEIGFDICDDNHTVTGSKTYNKLLDMRIGVACDNISFDLWHVNWRFALSGSLEYRKKFRFPQPLGLKQTVLERL